MLERITEPFRTSVLSQIVAHRIEYLRRKKSKLDSATITQTSVRQFEKEWTSLERRVEIVPGKDVLRILRDEVQEKYGVTLTNYRLVEGFRRVDIPSDLAALLTQLNDFRRS